MKIKALALFLALGIACAGPVNVSAQTQTGDPWALVRQTSVGETLEVKLKSGKTVRGTLYGVTDHLLSVFRKRRVIDMDRQDIRKVYLIDPDVEQRGRTLAGIGGLAGFFVGLAVTLRVGFSEGSGRGPKKVIAGAAIPVGMVGGTLAGRAIGRRGARRLIYEAP